MRSSPTIGITSAFATALGGALASHASASPWTQTFNLGDLYFPQHTTAFGDDPVLNLLIEPQATFFRLEIIRISFDYDEVDANGNPAPDSSWASDLGMVFNFNSFETRLGYGGSFRNLGALAGGYGIAEAVNAVDFYLTWDFDGSGSDDPGPYFMETLIPPLFIVYPFSVDIELTDTWNGNTIYRDFTITMIFIPGPAGIAPFAIACALALRRRRSPER